ncbi:sulfotransferase [Aquibium sp. ELW1220]|uniref:sulfotransferase family protein n=1 Tax=Aquibium sp. ELW1220 TaxID=2976766 RepID=UPI0025B1FF20|nr:sulfotransferase [Aquibium sp. ELW1220]MDN2583424.1 sulfotransferase [Aquibium sp. ELW1220]
MTALPDTITQLRHDLSMIPPPVVFYCKSHSGSRLLARLVMAGGVWLGDRRNESEDSADILRLVEPLVERHFPDFSRLFSQGDEEISALARDVLTGHLRGRPDGAPWGWKLCETGYALPLLLRIFPRAQVVHLLRDGRDVAFCDHVAPESAFWKKVFFGTDRIRRWNGLKLTYHTYLRHSHVFNAQHWVNSVSVGRRHGAMAGANYHEIRYEHIVADPVGAMRGLFDRLGLPMDEDGVRAAAGSVHADSVGKHRAMPEWQVREALRVLAPTLGAFGYATPPARAGRFARILGRLRAS